MKFDNVMRFHYYVYSKPSIGFFDRTQNAMRVWGIFSSPMAAKYAVNGLQKFNPSDIFYVVDKDNRKRIFVVYPRGHGKKPRKYSKGYFPENWR
jgi:hypothetical protein